MISWIWKSVSLLNNAVAAKIGWSATGMIPFLATIETVLNNDIYGKTFLSRLLNLFEAVPFHLPLNLTRLYWASLCYAIATAMINATCPGLIYMSREKWLHSDESAEVRKNITSKNPRIVPVELNNQVAFVYDMRIVTLEPKRDSALLVIVPLLLISVYFLAIVAVTNIKTVLPLCGIVNLFNYYSTTCR